MELTKNKIIKNWQFMAIGVIVLFHMVINYIWLRIDNFPLWFDYGGYFSRSIKIYYASSTSPSDFINAILGIGPYINVYQPHRLILSLFSLPWYYFFGISADVAVMSCSIFLAVSLFATYNISCKILDKTTSLLAVFILSVSPGFFTFYRRYSPEFACTAMITLAICLLLNTENFQNKKYSILSGVAFGLSMITKATAFIFLPGVFIYSVYKTLKEKKTRLLNIFLFLLSMLTIVFPLYWLHRKKVLSDVVDVAFSDKIREMFGMVERFSFSGITFYIKDMIDFSFPNPYFVFFILGTVLLLINKTHKRGILFFWLISSYLFLISAQTRATYYGMPLLIPVSIIAAYGINNLFRNKKTKLILIIFLLIFGIFKVGVYSFPIFGSSKSHFLNPDGYGNYLYPIKDNWKLTDIIEYLKENIDNPNKSIRIHVGANTYPFSPMTLIYVAAQKKIKLEIAGYITKAEEIPYFDFVIVKSGDKQGLFYSSEQAKEIIKAVDENKFFKLPKTFALPDNSVVTIYKNKAR